VLLLLPLLLLLLLLWLRLQLLLLLLLLLQLLLWDMCIASARGGAHLQQHEEPRSALGLWSRAALGGRSSSALRGLRLRAGASAGTVLFEASSPRRASPCSGCFLVGL